MKLILTILLIATSLFASKIKVIKDINGYDYYLGTNQDIPPSGIVPKNNNKLLLFYSQNDSRGSLNYIIDEKNKKAWLLNPKKIYNYHILSSSRDSCKEKTVINKKSIKTLDLNLLHFLLSIQEKDKKDLGIWVKVIDADPFNNKKFKIYSLTKNKYIESSLRSLASTVCEKNYQSILSDYKRVLRLGNKKKEQDIINKKKIDTLQVADESDQGLIIEIKGPLVKVQANKCIAYNSKYTECYEYTGLSQWYKKDKLTFKNQNKK